MRVTISAHVPRPQIPQIYPKLRRPEPSPMSGCMIFSGSTSPSCFLKFRPSPLRSEPFIHEVKASRPSVMEAAGSVLVSCLGQNSGRSKVALSLAATCKRELPLWVWRLMVGDWVAA